MASKVKTAVEALPPVVTFKPLVTKKSYGAWRRLPAQTKSWVSVEDLVQMGLMHLHESALPKWDEQSGTPLLVWLAILLDRFYANEVKRLTVKKRDEFGSESIDAMKKPCDRFASKGTSSASLLVAKDGLLKIYQAASSETKEEMECWFCSSKKKRLRRGGLVQSMVRAEFRELAQKVGFTADDFRLMVR